MWTTAALERVRELEPELMAEFGWKPLATERPDATTPRHEQAVYLDQIEAWLLERGVRAQVRLVDHRLDFDSVVLT